MKLNFKNKRFLQYQLEFYQEKKLSLSARELYSFIYNHCIEFHNQGWCGLNSKKLAEYLKCSIRTIEDNLRELKEKDMIIIENPGKRTKKTGESRQIHINAKNYITEEVPEDGNNELLKVIERQSKELEELKKEISKLRLEQAETTYITQLGYSLIQMNFITEEQYKKQAEELNHILFDFEKWHGQGRDLTMACFHYWKAHKESYIKNPVRYILVCINASKKWINNLEETDEEFYNERLKEFYEKWVTEKNEQ